MRNFISHNDSDNLDKCAQIDLKSFCIGSYRRKDARQNLATVEVSQEQKNMTKQFDRNKLQTLATRFSTLCQDALVTCRSPSMGSREPLGKAKQGLGEL